ncbi:unnamed protein product [Musa textilis]
MSSTSEGLCQITMDSSEDCFHGFPSPFSTTQGVSASINLDQHFSGFGSTKQTRLVQSHIVWLIELLSRDASVKGKLVNLYGFYSLLLVVNRFRMELGVNLQRRRGFLFSSFFGRCLKW